MPDSDRGLLYPLDAFYERAGLALPAAERISGVDVPEPYSQLLVHDRDMTPTLERFHGERITLEVIGRRHDDPVLSRLVVLRLVDTHKPVEFGAIAIHLDRFPEDARPVLLESRIPLGTVLADWQIPHRSRPSAFLRVFPDALVRGGLGLATIRPLYGRRNTLLNPDGQPLADVVEILPP